MTNKPDPRRGQALLLVTFALVAMCGLLGLAVDLGWGYFVKKSAQVSADAGALASAQGILSQVHQTNPITGKMVYSTSSTCPDTGDQGLSTGCQYAQQAGFGGTTAMVSGAQANFPPPTVPNLSVGFYWVTARAVQTIPQLFSAVLGDPSGISSARASAAIVTEYINGAVHTLNRQYDNITASGLPQGADIGGSGQIVVPSGLFMSSSSANAGSGPFVTGPITIVSPGNASGLGASPITEIGDSGVFQDPYRDISTVQPALPSVAGSAGTNGTLPTYGVLNGNIASGNVYLLAGTSVQQAIGSPFPSGNYVAINCSSLPCGSGNVVLDTIDQLTLTQSATFSDSSATCYPSTTSTFGCFFFYGGLRVSGATMTMGAGEFVMVGGGASGNDFVTANNAYLDSRVSCPNPSSCTTAGIIMIMTGTSSPITCNGLVCSNTNSDLYPNLGAQIASSPLLVQAATATTMLNFGSVSLLAGADSSGAAVTGLVAKNLPANLPSSNADSLANTLGPFDGVVVWQDQANSTIRYTTSLGYINTSPNCGGSNIDYPCTKTLPVAGSEAMTLQAPANTGIEGIVYQPRGAFLQTQGGTIQGPIQIITGAISMTGGGTINVTLPPTSAKRRVATLVE
jgi:hypothetical protein